MTKRWPVIRNCNFNTREDALGQNVWRAVAEADRGCEDCDLIGSLDDLEATLSKYAGRDSAFAEAECLNAEESVESAILAIDAAFEKED